MSRVKEISLSGVTADADGIATSQTPAAGGEQELTLTGTQPPTTMIIDIASVGNDSGRTFTVTGTDRYGEVISEQVTGANAGTAQTTKQFKTVTSVKVDANTAGAVTVGWAAVVYGAWIPLETVFDSVEIGLALVVSGTVNFDLEYTYRDLSGRFNAADRWDPPQYGDIEALAGAEAFTDADIDGDTVSIAKTLTQRATAIRLKINSGDGSLAGRLTQAGLR